MASSKKRFTYSQPHTKTYHKIFNIFMVVMLVVTMVPVSALTYSNQASADTLSDAQTSTLATNSNTSNTLSGNAGTENSLTGGVSHSLKITASKPDRLMILH